MRHTFKNYSQTNYTKFHDHISNFNWSSTYSNDVNTYAENLIKAMNAFYIICSPLCTKFATKKRICDPWINSTLLTLIKQKTLYFKLYRRGNITQEENITMKNKIISEIRKAKKNNITLSLKILKIICV